MDAIILAGGKGSRLSGKVAPYQKQLMLHPTSKMPLVVHQAYIVRQEVSKTVVVVAPENAMQVAAVFSTRPDLLETTRFVVQPEARGPGDALLLGIEMSDASRYAVLMADNTTPYADWRRVYDAAGSCNCVAVREVPSMNEAARYTRIINGKTLEDMEVITDPPYVCWIGPLIVDHPFVEQLYKVRDAVVDEELKIGKWLGLQPFTTVEVSNDTRDVGDTL